MRGVGKFGAVLSSGLDFLATVQRRDGGFSSLSTPDLDSFEDAKTYQTNFIPALILSCLADIDAPKSKTICSQLARFLLKERSKNWTFNYWSHEAPERTLLPYPDDLDDTFCALSALYKHDATLIDETALATIIKTLLATESSVGGPYRTWITASKKNNKVWQDVDVAVNSNINYFLSFVCKPLPNVTAFVMKAVRSKRLSSPYYPNIYPILYFMARSLPEQERGMLNSVLFKERRVAKNALDLALMVVAQLRVQPNCSARLRGHVKKLLGLQQSDGSWPVGAICIDPKRDEKTYYNGCAALTTAVVLEALCMFEKQEAAYQLVTPNKKTALVQDVQAYTRDLPTELARPMNLQLQKICCGRNGEEITKLAQVFNNALRKPLRNGLSQNFFLDLGYASAFGWLAYTIYDDFLDNEGKAELLSVANAAHRKSLYLFENVLPKNTAYKNVVRHTFDVIDNANAWEQRCCRLLVTSKNNITVPSVKRYGFLPKLAERSLGHTLTSLAILCAKKIRVNSPEFQSVQNVFKNYLIARQLNDDMHDWVDDFKNGRVTYVVQALLKDCSMGAGDYSLKECLPTMRKVFWNTTLPKICAVVRRHINVSRRAMRQANIFTETNGISALLDRLEKVVEHTLLEQKQARLFLKQYRERS